MNRARRVRRFKVALVITAAILLMALVAELLVFALAPPETLGWGERPSLRPDATFGWRLIESRTTRLRWQGYDYVVTSNSLGFPGPEFPQTKSPSTFRIMAVGGGFTSAEGVDTDQAWPRVLEDIFNRRSPDRSVEVLNFAVSGYGPEQFSELVREYAPAYEPNVILITLIPHDFRKVVTPVARTAQQVGFDNLDPNGVVAILTFRHLVQALRNAARDLSFEMFLRRPNPHGYNLGQFWSLEKGRDYFYENSQPILEKHLEAMRAVSETIGSDLVLLFIPASVQVCSPSQLSYFPDHVSVDDVTRYDMGQPQRRLAQSATRAGVEFVDLRAAFDKRSDDCPYHPMNLHWTASAHQTIAEFVATQIVSPSWCESSHD